MQDVLLAFSTLFLRVAANDDYSAYCVDPPRESSGCSTCPFCFVSFGSMSFCTSCLNDLTTNLTEHHCKSLTHPVTRQPHPGTWCPTQKTDDNDDNDNNDDKNDDDNDKDNDDKDNGNDDDDTTTTTKACTPHPSCVAEFTYKGKNYSGCIDIDASKYWCSTTNAYSDETYEYCTCKVAANDDYSAYYCVHPPRESSGCSTCPFCFVEDLEMGGGPISFCTSCLADLTTNLTEHICKSLEHPKTKQPHPGTWCPTQKNNGEDDNDNDDNNDDNDDKDNDNDDDDTTTTTKACTPHPSCVAEFTYKGKNYSGCIDLDASKYWCSTTDAYSDETYEYCKCKVAANDDYSAYFCVHPPRESSGCSTCPFCFVELEMDSGPISFCTSCLNDLTTNITEHHCKSLTHPVTRQSHPGTWCPTQVTNSTTISTTLYAPWIIETGFDFPNSQFLHNWNLQFEWIIETGTRNYCKVTALEGEFAIDGLHLKADTFVRACESHQCNAIFFVGTLRIMHAKDMEDLAFLDIVEVITGSLIIQRNPNLLSVTGPSLRYVHHIYIGENRALEKVTLPRLQIIEGYGCVEQKCNGLNVDHNPSLVELDLQNLTSIVRMSVNYNAKLHTIKLLSLKSLDDIRVVGNAHMCVRDANVFQVPRSVLDPSVGQAVSVLSLLQDNYAVPMDYVDPCGCGAGWFAQENKCLFCPAGFYCSGGIAPGSPCPSFMTSENGSESSLDCKCVSGFQLDPAKAGFACQSCERGKFSSKPLASQLGLLATTCVACKTGTFAPEKGSTQCQKCPTWLGWDSLAPDVSAVECSVRQSGLAFLLASSSFFIAGFLLMFVTPRLWTPITDVSLEPDDRDGVAAVLHPAWRHFWRTRSSTRLRIVLRDTGHFLLDRPEGFLVDVRKDNRLFLLDMNGEPIRQRVDTSKGSYRGASLYDDLIYSGLRQFPRAIVVLFLWLAACLAAFLEGVYVNWGKQQDEALSGFMYTHVFWMVISMSCIFAAIAARGYRHYKGKILTPLDTRLKHFRKIVRGGKEASMKIQRVPKGPLRAIELSKVLDLRDFFGAFIRDRNAYYLDSNILRPLTITDKVSYAEFVGPSKVMWFVSHFWGNPFNRTCESLSKHAMATSNSLEFRKVSYWICFFSNNQYQIPDELGYGDVYQSAFYLTLQSGHVKGTCMVLDENALPFTRAWCIFELLQTLLLDENNFDFAGLILCTESGCLNQGTGSVDAATAIISKLALLDLKKATATQKEDQDMIQAEVLKQMGSFEAMHALVRDRITGILRTTKSQAEEQFDSIFRRLSTGTAEESRVSRTNGVEHLDDDDGVEQLKSIVIEETLTNEVIQVDSARSPIVDFGELQSLVPIERSPGDPIPSLFGRKVLV